MKKNYFNTIYEILLGLLALLSITLVIFDLSGYLQLSNYPYKQLDYFILIIFWIDYSIRLYKAQGKIKFIKSNIFDLIAIMPLNEIFSLFRVARLFRLAKLSKLSKLVKATKAIRAFAFMNVVNSKIKKFLHTNGFIYVLYCSLVLIFASSCIMSVLENQSFLDALWWSIVTCTTVGYGDISPSTAAGRIVAVILMIFGIGFIGMLTGTITSFFSQQEKTFETVDNELKSTISTLTLEQKIIVLKTINTLKNLEEEQQNEIWSSQNIAKKINESTHYRQVEKTTKKDAQSFLR